MKPRNRQINHRSVNPFAIPRKAKNEVESSFDFTAVWLSDINQNLKNRVKVFAGYPLTP